MLYNGNLSISNWLNAKKLNFGKNIRLESSFSLTFLVSPSLFLPFLSKITLFLSFSPHTSFFISVAVPLQFLLYRAFLSLHVSLSVCVAPSLYFLLHLYFSLHIDKKSTMNFKFPLSQAKHINQTNEKNFKENSVKPSIFVAISASKSCDDAIDTQLTRFYRIILCISSHHRNWVPVVINCNMFQLYAE